MKIGRSTAPEITRYLRQQIASGAVVAGVNLPAERALAVRFGVSRPTVRAAFMALVHEGLIVRARGRGTAVVGRGTAPQVLLSYSLPRGRPPEQDGFLAELVTAFARLPGEWSGGVRLLVVDSDQPHGLPATSVSGGVIFAGWQVPSPALLQQLAERGVPAVVIGERSGSVPIPEIRGDHRRCGELAAQHMIAHGHRHVVLIDGPADHHPCRLRSEGFLAAGGTAVIEGCAWDRARSRHAVETALAGVTVPTALVISGHQGLMGANDVLRARGLSAPRDLALLAVGILPLAVMALEQPASAFVEDIYGLALSAARLLAALRAGQSVTATTLVANRLIVGRTCGCVEAPDQRK